MSSSEQLDTVNWDEIQVDHEYYGSVEQRTKKKRKRFNIFPFRKFCSSKKEKEVEMCGEMAGVAQNVQVVSSDKSAVFEPDLTFNINSSESTSLQELIDSELALRISNSDPQEPETELIETINSSQNNFVETIPVRTVHPITFELEPDINEQFIYSEKEHTSFQLVKNNVNLSTSEAIVTDFETSSTDDLNLYENLIDIEPNTYISESNPVTDVVLQDNDSTEIFNTKEVEIPITDLDKTDEVPPVSTVNTQLIEITNVNDSQPHSVDVIETDQEPSENIIVTNCDLSEQNNKISNVVDVVIESINSDNDVNNSMSEINCCSVDLINNVDPLIMYPDEPDSSSSPVHSDSPTSPIYSDGISPSSPVQVEVCSPSSPFQIVDLSPSAQPDVIIQVNGAAPVFEEDGFDTWMTVEDAMKDPDDLSPDHNIAQQTEIFDVFETIDDGHYEDVIERSRLTSENSLDAELVKQVDDATIEEQKNVDQHDGDATCIPVVHDQFSTVSLSDHSLSDGDLTESSTTMTKTGKKKKSLEGGEAVVTRTKKTKKTKKSDEKENHISVITNGHDHYSDEPALGQSSSLDDDELSNVCVRDLKQTYCREAAKSLNGIAKVPSEEPIPPAVSIRELRRSFGDLRKACEANEQAIEKLSPINANHLKARSLGDLRRLTESPQLKRNIHTGVSVKALAASYWSLISHEPETASPPSIKFVPHSPMKSSFSKFDQLSKKSVLHVRSSDSTKAQKQFQGSTEGVTANPSCKACGKTVFAMEQIKAERSVWHKNCFRCKECNKQLTLDIYQSHEGELYCKPHFRELFKPKAVLDNTEDEPVRRRKPEMIIRENQPMELPPDVVRASDKADLGLEELSALNVKSRFQVFEKPTESEVERSPSTVNVKRSPSILSKLAKFQKKGMDVGVTDESLNGVEYEESASSSEEETEEGVIKSSKLTERPVSFNKMDDVKRSWESGQTARRAEMREEHKKEIQNMRSRLFLGKQGKMKEMYEQAVAESEGRGGTGSAKKEVEQLGCEKARLMKERFEKGEPITDSEDEDGEKKKTKDTEDMSVFEAGISKKSRSLFMELDATAAKTQASPVHTPTPRPRTSSQGVSRQVSDDVVRSSDVVEDVVVETADVSSKFKFFETFKAPEKERKAFRITPPREGQVKDESPDREIYRDPEVVRSEDQVDDDELVKRSHTTSKMLSLFRQMEEAKEPVPEGPKPLKCFTPPPDYKEEQTGSSDEEDDEESEEEGEESEEDTGIVRASDKVEDEFLKQAQNAARAKTLKAKFEHWEPEKQSVNNAINLLDTEQDSIESTKSLRARFESLKSEQPKEKARPKVNRFVEAPSTNICAACDKKVYHLEKVEASGKIFHKDCFRCTQCNCKLRMESYTLNNGQVYCLPHFRQLFIAKGNYDEGFGSDQHKRKWEPTQTVNGTH